jgi:hypothetical protein
MVFKNNKPYYLPPVYQQTRKADGDYYLIFIKFKDNKGNKACGYVHKFIGFGICL